MSPSLAFPFMNIPGPARSILKLGVCLLALIQLQCTWTPSVETSFYQGRQGTISLKTTNAFHISPAHPASLSKPLLKQILRNLTYTRTAGLLQNLLDPSSLNSSPLFSENQSDFLANHLSQALAKATPEEMVTFLCLPLEEKEKTIKGTIAFFAPKIFYMTIETSKNPSGSAHVTPSQRNSIRPVDSLHFSLSDSALTSSEVLPIVDTPAHASWIAIDIDHLPSSIKQEGPHSPSPENDIGEFKEPGAKEESTIKELEMKLDRLQERIEDQDKEIQRLQRPSP